MKRNELTWFQRHGSKVSTWKDLTFLSFGSSLFLLLFFSKEDTTCNVINIEKICGEA